MNKFSRLVTSGLRNPASFLKLLFQLPKLVRLSGRLLLDARVKFQTKLILLAGIIYFISPIDIFPDFLVPVIAYFDDIAVLAFCFQRFLSMCPNNVLMEHAVQIGAESPRAGN